MDRIIGAFTFRKGVYAEVEQDASFTNTAWAIVAIVALLNQVSSYFTAQSASVAAADFLAETDLGAMDLAVSPFTIVSGTIVAVLAFAVGAFVVAWVGKTMFKADVNFNEVVRTMGLANVWGAVGVLGGLLSFVPLLLCAVSPLLLAASLLSIAASALAVKEALDLEWGQTIVTVIIAWVAIFIINLVVGGVLGVGSAVLGG
ncbi:MAG: YIP1 family protein, partial [Anaerolineales bacterium]|nr:YIP1 family protein [Anaerolineales bacterium]